LPMRSSLVETSRGLLHDCKIDWKHSSASCYLWWPWSSVSSYMGYDWRRDCTKEIGLMEGVIVSREAISIPPVTANLVSVSPC
jgi:hypothetical protein